MNKRFFILIPFLLNLIFEVNAEPFRFIVATDGSGTHSSVQAAIDACPDNQRSIIFIKSGTYYGQTFLGTKAVASTKLISLVGEDRNKVILTYDKALPMVTKFEEATTFQIYAKDFYAENITFANTAGVSAGQALALYTAGDKATFKNCYLKGFQDTYRSKKGTRAYWKDCKIEGTVDFIYAGGTVFFDDCEIYCLSGGGYIVAPEDAYQTIPKASTVCNKFLRLGFIFRNCNITAENGVANNSYFLGRPWNSTAGAFYLNCKLGKHINAKGWKEWNGNETTASFAEYNSMDASGNPVDITGRVSWSFQLPKADVDNLLTPAGIYARINATEVYDPLTICISPTAPTNVVLTGNVLSWNAVEGVAGYIIYKDDKFLTQLIETTFTDISVVGGIYTVRAINSTGVLSDASSVLSAIKTVNESKVNVIVANDKIEFSEPVAFNMYSINGKSIAFSNDLVSTTSLKGISKGIYLLQLTDCNHFLKQLKIVVL